MHELETWIIAGTSSSTIASYSGNQYGSVSGGEVQKPPDGSGLRLHPTKPSVSTQRRSSATTSSRAPSGVCGSWHTAAKLSGKRPTTRATRSLLALAQATAVAGSGTWCSMPDALGEKSITSPPRSRRMRSWLSSTLARTASSLIAAGSGTGRPGSSSRASWASRKCLMLRTASVV